MSTTLLVSWPSTPTGDAMTLTVREAATLLGCSPRTVRNRLARGEIQGQKKGHAWVIPHRALPLAPKERERLASRAEAVRTAVDEALPEGVRREWSVADLTSFKHGAAVLRAIEQAEPSAHRDDALSALREALVGLSVAHHEYTPTARLEALRRTRAGFAQAVAWLQLDGTPEGQQLARTLEQEALPPLAGLFRNAERRRAKRRRDP